MYQLTFATAGHFCKDKLNIVQVMELLTDNGILAVNLFQRKQTKVLRKHSLFRTSQTYKSDHT